ncbi:hypothetical protein A4R35_03350 [Thermogemmatispora tikiterensis]|uniref:Uncharacterized protein n=1 Tax=Thermogemmatispora tikiterensis TaxID=1825093 RepID=A0A328VJX4_9CHLR|nr:hypothetical protein A4R35_03350 [Thermogemmatispora tikiterensis]
MDLIEVDVVGSKAPEAVINLAENGFARETSPVRSFAHAEEDFGGNDNLIALDEVFQGAPEDLLAGSQ